MSEKTIVDKEKRRTETKDLRAFTQNADVNYVFISYSSANWEVVLNGVVRNMIDRYGLRVYFDKNFGLDNDLWEDNMKAAIETSKCVAFLAFISKDYMKSYPCLMEALMATSLNTEVAHDDKPLEIIPIFVDDSNDFPDAKSKSSASPDIKEWGTYTELIRSALESGKVNGSSDEQRKLKRAITVLESKQDKVTYENLSNALAVLVKGYNRKYNRSDEFYEELYETIYKIDKDAFDESLKGIYSSKEGKPAAAEKDDHAKPDMTKKVSKKAEKKSESKTPERKETQIVSDSTEKTTTYCGKSNAWLKLLKDGEYQLLAGSIISKNEAESCPVGAKKAREESLQSGEWSDIGDGYKLMVDKKFKSLSGAAYYVTGYSVNGKSFWQETEETETEETETTSTSSKTPEISSKPTKISPKMTLKELDKLLEDVEICMYIRQIRGNKALFSKQIFDYVMAAALRGCDQKAEAHSGRWNYCRCAVAKNVDLDPKSKPASQFTWSSNARQAINIDGNGKLGPNSDYFQKLSENMTLAELRSCFAKETAEAFCTKDNEAADQVFKVLFGKND